MSNFKIYKNITPAIQTNSAFFNSYKNIALLQKMDYFSRIKLLKARDYLE
tara:strand:+ start:183 stop:332 length:150 start_codon:yes stop_codon:yes gene_type:complete